MRHLIYGLKRGFLKNPIPGEPGHFVKPETRV